MNKKIKNPAFILILVLILTSLACNLLSYEKSSAPVEAVGEQSETVPTQVVVQEEVPAEEQAPTDVPAPIATVETVRPVTLKADGSGDYPTLEAAIEGVEEGSIIMLEAGMYNIEETLRISKALTLQGAGKDQTILSNGQPEGVFVYNGSGMLELNGITFQYTGTESGSAASIENGEFQIVDCRFTATQGPQPKTTGNGLILWGTSNGSLLASRFDRNQFFGLFVIGEATVTVESCEFFENGMDGVLFSGQSHGTVRGSVSSNNVQHGFSARGDAQVVYEGCVTNGNGAVGFGGWDNTVVEIKQSKIYQQTHHGVNLGGNTVVTVTDCDIYENGQDGFMAHTESQLIATENRVYDNKLHGFAIVGQANATIENNEINNNASRGIAFGESASGVVQGNTCAGNDEWFYNDSDQEVTVGENNCE